MAVTETNQNRRSVWAQRVTLDAPDFAGGTATVFAPGVVLTDDIDISSDAGPGFSFTGRVTAPGVVEIYQQLEPGAGAANPVVETIQNLNDAGAFWAPMPILANGFRTANVAVAGVLVNDDVALVPRISAGPTQPSEVTAVYRAVCTAPGVLSLTVLNTSMVALDLTGENWILGILAFRAGGGGGGSYPALPGPTEFAVQAFRTLNMAYGISG